MPSKYYTEETNVGRKLEADPSFMGVAPGDQRTFRDVGFGLIFFMFLIGMAVCTGVAAHNSDLSLLEHDASNAITADFAKVKDNKNVILVGCLCTAALAFIWLEFLKRFTNVVVWVSLIGAICIVTAVGVSILASAREQSKVYLQVVGIVVLVFAALLALLVVWLRKKISFSARIIAVGCRGIQANPGVGLLTVPVCLVISAGFLVWWLATLLYLFSIKGSEVTCEGAGYSTCKAQGCDWGDDGCYGEGYNVDKAARWATLFLVFMFFWGSFFLAGAARTAVSGPIAAWYFRRDKQNSSSFSTAASFLCYVFTYHFGSIAEGSLLVATFRFINWCLEQAKRESTNLVVKIVLCCVQCILACVEGFIRFVTKYAYVYIAMHGDSFSTSCREVSHLFARNKLGTLFLNHLLTNLICYMGMFLSCGAVILGCTLYMKDHGGLSGSAITVLIAFCLATFWIIGLLIEVASDTVIVCYLEDDERHQATRDFRGDDTYTEMEGIAKEHAQYANVTKFDGQTHQVYGAA